MVHTKARPGGSTISKQNQKAIRCYASAVHGLLTSLASANSQRRMPDIATPLRNYGSQCKSTQDIIVLSDDDIDDGVQVIMTHQSSYKLPHSSGPTMCAALQVKFPPGQTPNNSYPFMMHDTNMLQWDIEICWNVLYLHTWDCSGVPEGNQAMCRACRSLLDDLKLQGILDQIVNGTTPSTPHQYWSWGVLQNNLLQIRKHLANKELLLFNNYVKLGQ